MEAGHACIADPLDTVHHEMGSVVCSHHVYKTVWSPVIGEQLVLEKDPVSQSTQRFCSGNDKGFSDSGLHSVRKLFTDCMVIYYMKKVCHLSYY